MNYGELGKFNDLAQAAVSGLKWQRDVADLVQNYAAAPKLELPPYWDQKSQDPMGTYALGLGQSPALKDAIAAHKELLAHSRIQIRLQEIAQGLGQSFGLSNLGGLTAWRGLVAVDPTILKGVAGEAFSAMGIGKIGGLTGILGPKASAAAGLYGFTRSDTEEVHLREDRAVDIVLEAAELLSDEENVAALADVEVDEELIRKFESFFLTSEAAQSVYEAATAEIAIRIPSQKDKLQLRGMMVLSLFFVLYTFLICGTAAAKPGQEVTLADHQAAAVNSLQATGAIAASVYFLNRVRKMPDDGEEDLEEDQHRGKE